MKSNIALIGFMGTGKTAVGRVLAGRLGKRFIETDALIEERAGMPISEVFRKSGEIAFRELEIAVIKDVAGEKNAVIACGGGVVLNKINIDRLKENAVVVYLTAAPSAVLRRVSAQPGQRPLLNVEDPLAAIRDLQKSRRQLYERAADITVNTSRLAAEGVAEKIIEKLKEHEGFHFEKRD